MLVKSIGIKPFNSIGKNYQTQLNKENTQNNKNDNSYKKMDRTSFGMDPIITASLILAAQKLAFALLALGGFVAALHGTFYAVSKISEWVDDRRNKAAQLLKEQILDDQDKIHAANNSQLTKGEVKKAYQAEMDRVLIKPNNDGKEVGLNKIIGNSLLKLGITRNILLPLLQVMDGDEKAKRKIPNGVCFFGPPGTGKTFVSDALGEHYKEKGGYFEKLEFTGDNEQDILKTKKLFADAEQRFKESDGKKYTLILLDEAEKSATNVSVDNAHTARTSTLLKLVNNCKDRGTIFVSTTNNLSKVSSDLLRKGRTDLRVPIAQVEIFEVADMFNYYIQNAGLTSKNINFKEITDEIRTKALAYKPKEIEQIVARAINNSTENNITTDSLKQALILSDLEFNKEEKAQIESEKLIAKKLGGLNENARYSD